MCVVTLEHDSITLILGLTLGLAVVGVAIGFFLMIANARQAQQTVVLPSSNGVTYRNEEKWSVVKDVDGRVQDIIVHREATEN
jgi:hypothetical protein